MTNAETPREQPARMTAPLAWRVVDGDDLYYPSITDLPVTYIRVKSDDRLLLFIWASDDDVAGDTISVESGGDLADNANVEWTQQLRKAKALGLGPLAAIRELLEAGTSIPEFGRVDVAAGLGRSTSVETLEALTTAINW